MLRSKNYLDQNSWKDKLKVTVTIASYARKEEKLMRKRRESDNNLKISFSILKMTLRKV